MNMVDTSTYLYLPQYLIRTYFKEMEMQLGALLDTTPSRSCSLDIVMEWLYEGLTEVTIWK